MVLLYNRIISSLVNSNIDLLAPPNCPPLFIKSLIIFLSTYTFGSDVAEYLACDSK